MRCSEFHRKPFILFYFYNVKVSFFYDIILITYKSFFFDVLYILKSGNYEQLSVVLGNTYWSLKSKNIKFLWAIAVFVFQAF